MNNIATNLPEQPTKLNRTLNGLKKTVRFTKSVLYLTKKVFML